MKEMYSPAILASYATFKELYNEGKYKSPYQMHSAESSGLRCVSERTLCKAQRTP